jgi:hypothetical protein
MHVINRLHIKLLFFKFTHPYLPQFLGYNYDFGDFGNEIQNQRKNYQK